MLLETSKEGRRERRAREMRRKILVSALDLFAQRGIDAVTVEEIADRADVARGTVFNHFATKDSLCHAMGELQLEALEDAIRAGRLDGLSIGDRIAEALRVMAEFPGRTPEGCRGLLTRTLASLTPGELPEHRRQWFKLLDLWVTEGQRDGEFRTDVASCELAGFIMGLQFQSMLLWSLGFVEGSLGEHQARALRFGLEGIRTRHPGDRFHQDEAATPDLRTYGPCGRWAEESKEPGTPQGVTTGRESDHGDGN